MHRERHFSLWQNGILGKTIKSPNLAWNDSRLAEPHRQSNIEAALTVFGFDAASCIPIIRAAPLNSRAMIKRCDFIRGETIKSIDSGITSNIKSAWCINLHKTVRGSVRDIMIMNSFLPLLVRQSNKSTDRIVSRFPICGKDWERFGKLKAHRTANGEKCEDCA